MRIKRPQNPFSIQPKPKKQEPVVVRQPSGGTASDTIDVVTDRQTSAQLQRLYADYVAGQQSGLNTPTLIDPQQRAHAQRFNNEQARQGRLAEQQHAALQATQRDMENQLMFGQSGQQSGQQAIQTPPQQPTEAEMADIMREHERIIEKQRKDMGLPNLLGSLWP